MTAIEKLQKTWVKWCYYTPEGTSVIEKDMVELLLNEFIDLLKKESFTINDIEDLFDYCINAPFPNLEYWLNNRKK